MLNEQRGEMAPEVPHGTGITVLTASVDLRYIFLAAS